MDAWLGDRGCMGRGGGRRNRRQSPGVQRSTKSERASGALPSPRGGLTHRARASPPAGGPTSSLTLGSEPHQMHKRTGRAEGTAAPWGVRGEADLLVTQSRECKSHILAGAQATAEASRAQLPSWAPGLGRAGGGDKGTPTGQDHRQTGCVASSVKESWVLEAQRPLGALLHLYHFCGTGS